MRDKELKQLLKSAYQVEPSQKEKAFLKTYEKRRLRFWDVLLMEFRYMGVQSLMMGVLLCGILFILAKQRNATIKWMVSSLLPLFALIPSVLVGRSERCGMGELEASSRFSLRFIRLIRMLILGMVSLLMIMAGIGILQKFSDISFVAILGFVGLPYLFNVWSCLLITRKWHGKESIFGCAGATVVSCFMPYFAEIMNLGVYLTKPLIGVTMMVFLFMTIRESILYIKDGEDLSWNLC